MKSTFTRNVDSVNITSFLWFNYSKIIKSATKMGKNTSTILYCCFSKWTYTLSHQTTLCHKKTKFAFISSIYLVFLPLEMQKRLKQTQVYHTFFFFYFIWKETTLKPLNVPAAKALFSNEYVIGTTCFDESFLLYVITGGHYFQKQPPEVF